MSSKQIRASLAALVGTPGVSGAEERVAGVVRESLAEAGYSADEVQSDELGNHWISLGPTDEPAQRIFIAHMDEIGWRVASIRADGCCHLAPIGGMDPQLWEGTKVTVHTRNGEVPGCIAPVSHHVSYHSVYGDKRRIGAGELLLDVGAGSPDAIRDMGIQLLDTVTWDKQLVDIEGGLVQGRSLDDRFGCCALVMLAQNLHGHAPAVPTVIAWSVQEEVGLKGAEALARRFAGVRETIAVDSFTVGTGPRDVKTYDAVKLGGGAVLRSWDNRMLVPDEVRDKLLKKAAALGHQLQYGFMPGGNDSAPFYSGDTRRLCFSVALQYSHSQVERINLLDLERLIALLTDWAGTNVELRA